MAKCSRDDAAVIFQQPTLSAASTAYKDEVIMEGVCDQQHLVQDLHTRSICLPFHSLDHLSAGGLAAVGWCCVGAVAAWFCGMRVARSWSLQLSQTGIYLRRKHHVCLCAASEVDLYLRLADIKEIAVEERRVCKWYCVCSEERCNTTVRIVLKEGIGQDLLSHLCFTDGPINEILPAFSPREDTSHSVEIAMHHCLNAEEFVQRTIEQMTVLS